MRPEQTRTTPERPSSHPRARYSCVRFVSDRTEAALYPQHNYALTCGFSVGLLRLELRTSALSVLRSNQLSYSPDETVTLHQLHRYLPGRHRQRSDDRQSRLGDGGLRLLGDLRYSRDRLAVIEVHDPDSGRVAPLSRDLSHRGTHHHAGR